MERFEVGDVNALLPFGPLDEPFFHCLGGRTVLGLLLGIGNAVLRDDDPRWCRADAIWHV